MLYLSTQSANLYLKKNWHPPMQTMQNTISLQDENGRQSAEKNLGAVYTPASLADWVARTFIEMASLPSNAVVCDPACGDGELLRAVQANRPSMTLLGIDVDPSAVETALKRKGEGRFLFMNCDALGSPDSSRIPSWAFLFGKKNIDGVIANPPWGADLNASRQELTAIGYSFAKGQFDSWNLFVEATLNNLRPAGTAAFIIPDSIFLPEHARMREFLHSNVQIALIARLGEGFFPEVFRGTAIVIVRKTPPGSDHQVETLRLNREDRSAVLTGKKTLDEIRRAKAHLLPQSRFQNDLFGRWDIDSAISEDAQIHAYTTRRSDWTQWLCSGRGVELSKFGHVDVCPACDFARPASKKPDLTCANCGHTSRSLDFRKVQIVKDEPSNSDAFPFLVGEDVGRYFASPSRYIAKSVSGINYKSQDVYSRRRLLIRKTGVGIKAAIVNQPSMTNQVVFHYFENPALDVPPFFLSYCLGILGSRTLLAYHLRTNGDNEWRSHPYITQKVISGLPIPQPVQGTESWKQARAIATLVDQALARNELTIKLDAKIEGLVAAQFGFDDNSYSWVERVLSQAESLEPIRALQLGSRFRVTPQWAS